LVVGIDLLPNSVFSRMLKQLKKVAAKLSEFLRELFAAMAHRTADALEKFIAAPKSGLLAP
jgi:hypothetical protein